MQCFFVYATNYLLNFLIFHVSYIDMNPYHIVVQFSLLLMVIGFGIFIFWLFAPIKKILKQARKAKIKAIKTQKKFLNYKIIEKILITKYEKLSISLGWA